MNSLTVISGKVIGDKHGRVCFVPNVPGNYSSAMMAGVFPGSDFFV
jgi:hypothetical protein